MYLIILIGGCGSLFNVNVLGLNVSIYCIDISPIYKEREREREKEREIERERRRGRKERERGRGRKEKEREGEIIWNSKLSLNLLFMGKCFD